MPTRASGFNLVELLVTMAVLAVALAVAVPSFNALRDGIAGANTLHALTGSLASARMAAVMRGRAVSVCPSSDGRTCRKDLVWDDGWLVYADPLRQEQPASADSVIWHVQAPSRGIAVRSTVGRHRVRYQASGLSGGNNLTLRLCSLRDGRFRGNVIVNLAGRPRTERADSAENSCPYRP